MVNIYVEGQLIDQFNDENVEIVSRVLDVSDITKTQGDYSKTFTVPASKTNNKIFKHWYNASIDSGFDARVKVDGRIDIDGIPFKVGKFLLRSAQIDDGIITSYTINFFGNVTSLKDTIGEDELTDLDFSSYDHDYTDDDVIDMLKVDFSDTFPEVIYTPTAKRRYVYNSRSLAGMGEYADEVIAQEESNIHNIAFPDLGIINEDGYDQPENNAIGIQWNDLHPSLRCDTIIDAIEAKYTKANGYVSDIKFSRDFFDTTEFNRLYMLLSSKNDRPKLKPNDTPQDILTSLNYNGAGTVSTETIAYTGGPVVVQVLGDEYLFNLADGYGFHTEMWCNRQSIVGTSNVTVRYEMNIDGNGWETVQESSGTTFKGGAGVQSTTFKSDWHKYINNSGSNQVIRARYYVDVEGSATIHCRQRYKMGYPFGFTSEKYVYSTATTGDELEINSNLPKIKVIDFLKGIFQMFKLVIVPLEDGTLYVNTLNSFYSQGKEYEVSRYVDRGSLKVSRGDIISSLDLKFKKSDTVLADEFFNRNKRGYGDAKVRLENEFGELLEGEDLIIDLPFEQLLYERPRDSYDGGPLRLQLPHLIDRENNPVNPNTVLHYVNGLSQALKPIMILRDTSGVARYHEVDDVIYVPSHHPESTDPFTSLLFDSEYSTWDSALLTKTLYSNHYDNYVSSVFDIGRRTYNYTAKLPTIVSANLKLNDVIIIDGYRYRINTYKYNMLTGLSELELVNKIDTSLAPFNGAPPILRVGYEGDTFSFNLPNADDYTITEVNLGDGTNWTSISTSFDTDGRGADLPANRVDITVSQNTVKNGYHRRVKIEFELNGVTTSMIIIQDEEE
ncbi:MAG: hypothetical protein GY823_09025 [Flavobacteriaceae bacterium]|nr:hypothetical protein [Flavobacteriaceae bacterium]